MEVEYYTRRDVQDEAEKVVARSESSIRGRERKIENIQQKLKKLEVCPNMGHLPQCFAASSRTCEMSAV